MSVFYKVVCMVVLTQVTILAFLLHFHSWKREVLNFVIYILDGIMSFAIFCSLIFYYVLLFLLQ